MTLKKGDTVRVIAGREKGKQGVVESSMPTIGRVVIAGVNLRKHHLKPNKNRPKGGISEYPAAMSQANVTILCPHCSQTTRVKIQVADDGKKYRACRKCFSSLDS